MATGEGAGGLAVALSSAGVTLLLDVADGRLPAVVHWGQELPALTPDEALTLVGAGVELTGPNDVDVPVRLSLLPEAATGWTGRPGLQGSRAGSCWTTRFESYDVTLDGSPVVGVALGGPGVVRVRARDAEAALGLDLEVELLPTGLVRSRATLTNLEDDPYTVDALSLAYPLPGEAGELLDFAGRWGRERAPQRQPLSVGTHLRENRRGRTGADSAYVLHAGTPGFGFADGEVYAVHTAFSGNHVHYAEHAFNGRRLLGGGELLLSGEVRLGRDETYESPWVYAAYGVGLDEIARRFHAHLRARRPAVSTQRPVTLNVWEAVEFDHGLDRLLGLAGRAAKVGVERFVLDDGWFGARRNEQAGLGDWVVSPRAWPHGLHPLVDRVRALGMEFGLWFEPEMVNVDSDVARAHPEWLMASRADLPVEARHQQVLNLGIPQAFAYVKRSILAVLDEYAIDYVKWDHNRDLVEAGDRTDAGRPGVHAQTLAFYRLVDEIRAVHPALEIESCSSGGGRIDLAVLERTDRVWVSDCIDPVERQHMMRWTTQLVPPEYLGSHIASERSSTTGRAHSLSFRAATAVFGHLGIEWDLTTVGDAELEELREWLEFFKVHRPLLLGGDVVRMDTYDENVFVHGVVAPDGSEALFAMATVGSQRSQPGPRLRLRGLDPERSYRVRPLVVGSPPPGLRVPPWFGERRPTTAGGLPPNGGSFEGCVLTGAAAARIGLTPPIILPDQAVLFRLTDAEESRLNF